MATVNVTNFDDFITAIGVSGDTVVLPIKAEWDLNTIHPEGISGNIQIRCAKIEGRDTEIKNIRFLGNDNAFVVNNAIEIENLHITNIIANASIFHVNTTSFAWSFSECKMSCLLGMNALNFNNGFPTFRRCSIAIAIESGEDSGYDGCMNFTLAEYCRLTINAPSKTVNPFVNMLNANTVSFCEVNLMMPNVTSIYPSNFSGCVLRGGCPLAYDTSQYGYSADFTSVFDVNMFPNDFTTRCPTFIGVTEEQMRSASYLSSIGFAIAR